MEITPYFLLKVRKNGKILKDQQGILTEVKTIYEQLCGQKNNGQEQIEINPSLSMIGRNDLNQSNKQFNFNPKRCKPKSSNTQCSKKASNREKLLMQSTLVSRVKLEKQ